MALPFFDRTTLSEHAAQLRLASYTPSFTIAGLVPGVDNVRHDVLLSPRFCELARTHIAQLVERHGNVEDIAREDLGGLTGAPAYARAFMPARPDPPKPAEIASEFKRLLAELETNAIQLARTAGQPVLDRLFRLALVKYFRSEIQAQYNQVLERCRAKLRGFEVSHPGRGLAMRERFQRFQVTKRLVCRRAGQELLTTQLEVENERIVAMRQSLLGGQDEATYLLFMNRLVFTEDGHDDYMNAEFYVMLGNYLTDVDRYDAILRMAIGFMRKLELAPDDDAASALLTVPENATAMTGVAPTGMLRDDGSPQARARRALLAAWMETLEEHGLVLKILAAYEAVPLLGEFSPLVNPQQLKNALISKRDRQSVEMLLESQGRPMDRLNAISRRVASYSAAERERIAGRFLRDFMRYHRDRTRLAVLNGALDVVHVVANEKMRELSRINGTLYEFPLPQEQKPVEERIVAHVVLKADIRDSTELTRSLMERGLNPASYFSLNFYEPVNKLLPKYEATKVFIEGDAVIVALFERDGEPPFALARTCMLAVEILDIVRAYNERSAEKGLPSLELGVGICYQDAAPLYLMDGEERIMISKALNESDRLASCSKRARRFLSDRKTPFHVFRFQTVNDEDAGGAFDEFALTFNVGGIHLNETAFRTLQQEITLRSCVLRLPTVFGYEDVKLYRGVVPIADGLFRKITVREARTAQIQAREFTYLRWTDRRYYEVSTDAGVEQMVDKALIMPTSTASLS